MSIERYEIVQEGEGGLREVVGYVELDPEKLSIFDAALTPVVMVDPDPEADAEEPSLDGWQLSPRTTLDTRPREETAPFAHVGPVGLKQAKFNLDALRAKLAADSWLSCQLANAETPSDAMSVLLEAIDNLGRE